MTPERPIPFTDPRSPSVRSRVRRTGWILAAVMAALFAGAACYIVFNGHKSRTVLHSQYVRATAPVAA